jgi:hypothetical protein
MMTSVGSPFDPSRFAADAGEAGIGGMTDQILRRPPGPSLIQ